MRALELPPVEAPGALTNTAFAVHLENSKLNQNQLPSIASTDSAAGTCLFFCFVNWLVFGYLLLPLVKEKVLSLWEQTEEELVVSSQSGGITSEMSTSKANLLCTSEPYRIAGQEPANLLLPLPSRSHLLEMFAHIAQCLLSA